MKSEARNKDTRDIKDALNKMRGKGKERTTKKQTEGNKKQTKDCPK